MQTMWLCWFLFLNIFPEGLCNFCPRIQNVERGGNITISCTLDGEVEGYLWYKGSTSESQAILRLENDEKGGTIYGNGHYDINSKGDMILINAQLEHEAEYTFVAIFRDDALWKQLVKVTVAVTPVPPCPLIESCSGCDNCTLTTPINETFMLTCYITEARPLPQLLWVDENQKHVVPESRSEVNRPSTDTWNISTTVLVRISSCNKKRLFSCVVNIENTLLTTTKRTVTVQSDQCENQQGIPGTRLKRIWNFVIYVVNAIFFLAILLAIVYCRCRKKFKVQRWVKKLKTFYEKELDNNYDEEGSFNREYNPIHEVSKRLNENNQDLLFFGKAGYGKTFLFQNILHLWIKGEVLQDAILIYFQLQFISNELCLLHELMRRLPGNFSSVDALNQSLQDWNIIVMLDGYCSISECYELSRRDSQPNKYKTRMSFQSLFSGNHGSFKHLKIWVSSTNENQEVFESFMKLDINDVIGNGAAQDNQLQQSSSKTSGNDVLEIPTKVETQPSPENSNQDEGAAEPTNNVSQERDPLLISSQESNTDENRQFHRKTTECPLIGYLNACIPADDQEIRKMITDFSSSSTKSKIVTGLQMKGEWDILACLLSTNREDCDYVDNVKSFQFKNVVFKNAYGSYNQEAVLRVCRKCLITETKLSSIDIVWSYPVELAVWLPKVTEGIKVKNAAFSTKADFKNFLRICLEKTREIQFCKCKLPKKFPSECKDTRDNHENDGRKFIRKQDDPTTGDVTYISHTAT